MSHIHKSCCPPLGRWVGLGRGQLGAPRCPELAHAHQRATAMAASRSRTPGEAALSGVGLRLRVPISSSTRVTLLLIHVHVSRISCHTPAGEIDPSHWLWRRDPRPSTIPLEQGPTEQPTFKLHIHGSTLFPLHGHLPPLSPQGPCHTGRSAIAQTWPGGDCLLRRLFLLLT